MGKLLKERLAARTLSEVALDLARRPLAEPSIDIFRKQNFNPFALHLTADLSIFP
jgi:hypothetical protein